MDLNVIEMVANFGFPCMVTMYLLVRIEAKFDKLSDSINELTISIRNTKQCEVYMNLINIYKKAPLTEIPKFRKRSFLLSYGCN